MSVVALADAGPAGGGKAHGLAVSLRAGLPVPDGFVVIDPAVDLQVVAENLRRLRGRAVAVRSSGLAEDGTTASFAGQLETVLGARGPEQVLAAIRRCAASPGTDRARGYRARLNLTAEPTAPGLVQELTDKPTAPVLVQELVEADHAGVLFTRDPRTGAGAVVINASWGLGESVVSGAVVPDEVVVTAPGGAVRVTVGAKQTRVDLGEHGLVRSRVVGPDRARVCVTPEEVSRLVGLGRRCEDLFGRPQDLEWAVRDGRIWLLQARPITALGAPAPGAGRRGPAPLEAGRDPAAPLVTGVPSSPGRVRGPVRLVRWVDEFVRFGEGDVLVCRTTDPAWTPLFRLAAAIVTETGGVLSHAAIVAREFGIPAVVGAGGAMARLTDGVPVTVDGTLGVVTAVRR